MAEYNSIIVPNLPYGCRKEEFLDFTPLDVMNELETFSRIPERENKNYTNPIIVRTFTGGRNNEQVAPFEHAVGEYLVSRHLIQNRGTAMRKVVFEYMDNSIVRTKAAWTSPSYLIDWLLQSHVHFIITQGLHMGLFSSGINWPIIDTYQELKR